MKRFTLRLLWGWALCFAWTGQGLAQSHLFRAQVKDESGKPVPRVQVWLVELGLRAWSDGEGWFSFLSLPEGQYSLKVDGPGFESVTSSVTVPWESEGIPEIILKMAVQAQMVVTGTRREVRLSDAPVRTEVVSRDQIQQQASRTLADAVESVTGVRVENNCQNCNFSQLRLLGLEGAYSQILLDSQPVLSAMASVYGVEHLSTAMMDRIEIVKGGGSALYGPGAVGGVVNVVSKRPTHPGGSFDLMTEQMDGEGLQHAGFHWDWVPSNQRHALSVYGQWDDADAVDVDGDGYTEAGVKEAQTLGLRFMKSLLEGAARWTVDGSYFSEFRRGGNRLDLPESLADVAEMADTRRTFLSTTWYHTPSTLWDYKLAASYALSQRDSYYGSGQDPNAYGESESPVLSLDAQVNRYGNRHVFTFGGQLLQEQLEDVQPAYQRQLDEKHHNVGFFVQDEWQWHETLLVTSGVRIDDHSELDQVVASPRLALKWVPMDDVTWRFSVSTGFRAPQVFDEDLHITQAGGEAQVIVNDPELAEERAVNLLANFSYEPKWGYGQALVEIAVFRTDLKDTFLLQENDDPLTDEVEFFRINSGRSVVQGIELNLGYAPHPRLQLEAGFVLESAKLDEPEGDFGVRDFFRTPDQYGVFSAKTTLGAGVDVAVLGKYTGKMWVPHYEGPTIEAPELVRSPEFFTWDLRCSRAFDLGASQHRSLTLALGARNLTNEYQQDLDQGPDRDAGFVYGPRYPRSYYLSASYQF